MLENFRLARQASQRIRNRYKVSLILLLVLSFSNTGQATSVRAAPPAQEMTNLRFYLNIHFPPTLCVGREYSIRVTPLVDMEGEVPSGQKVSYKERIITGIPIVAEITDKTIATVDPAKPQSKTSGYFSGDLWGTVSLEKQEKFGGLGEVVFKLTAKKAGTTSIYLTAKVPSQWSGGRDRYFGPQGMPAGGPIQVANCRYRVTALTNASASYPNLRSYLLSKVVGEMKSDDGTNFSGTASAAWSAFSFSALCSHSHTFAPAQARLSGTVDQDKLTVQITYEAAPFSSKSCASSNSGQLLAPPLIETVSSTGGSSYRTYSISWGAESMEGAASIYVTPLPSK